MMGTTTPWQQMEVNAELALWLKERKRTIWSRLYDGEHTHIVVPQGIQPDSALRGCRGIDIAIQEWINT